MSDTIHPDTTLGAVHLTVPDLDRALDFYRNAIGLQSHRREANTAALGAGADDLLVLVEHPGAQRVRGTTGLYHFAILLPTRLDLARALRNLAAMRTPLQGFADHLVSEAIYLADPDGNGIEIYRDRPRANWSRQDGQIQMATDPLDVDGLMAELIGDDADWAGLPPGTTIGHVHLHVASIPAAQAFYGGALGFEVVARYGPAALFVSAGGYHHHIGLNTWAGQGAPPPPPDAVGLRHFEVVLPGAAALDAVRDRARRADLAPEPHDNGFLLRDPSQNAVLLRVKDERRC